MKITASQEIKKRNIVCFSHLRWNFVFQRPQHLLTRAANDNKVYFFEEPVFGSEIDSPYLKITEYGNITVLTPHIHTGRNANYVNTQLTKLISSELKFRRVNECVAWYYTPMALAFTADLEPSLIVYDVMDELSGFNGAPPELLEYETKLFSIADIVFTGGRSLYESKKNRNSNVFLFPSSIDKDHFSLKQSTVQPEDQAGITEPKIGFFGVIDERLDIELLGKIAELKPDWNFVMIGPVVKIDQDTLPRKENIFYLGQKDYTELPDYIHSWSAAIMPFAKNKSTEFISPTKVLEYLAADKPVVSTSIKDVIYPYGKDGIVEIADKPEDFIEALETYLNNSNNQMWQQKVDTILNQTSWDMTWEKMQSEIQHALEEKRK